MISRDGIVLIDDSMRPRFASNVSAPTPGVSRGHFDGEWPWVRGPPKENVDAVLSTQRIDTIPYVDWYIFAHGLDFPQALKDFVTLSAPIPLLPRCVLCSSRTRQLRCDDPHS